MIAVETRGAGYDGLLGGAAQYCHQSRICSGRGEPPLEGRAAGSDSCSLQYAVIGIGLEKDESWGRRGLGDETLTGSEDRVGSAARGPIIRTMQRSSMICGSTRQL